MKLKSLSTIGYEGASISGFLETLKTAGITCVLDIREFAGSRRKGFAKTALREHLASVGIGYRHEPSLGSPREIRHRLREDGRHDRFFRDFDRYLTTQRPLLERLAGELTGSVTLLCYERHFEECHRSSVAASLGEMAGLKPRHHEVPLDGDRQVPTSARGRTRRGASAT